MRKNWLALALSLSMMIGTLTGCGGIFAGNSISGEGTNAEPLADEGGKVLNIYVWNSEFKERFEKYYPDYDKDSNRIGDVKVNFVTNTNKGGVYQKKLDEALKKQEAAEADKKLDIFLCEMDYVNKYTNTNMAVDVRSLGLTEDDMSQMYEYTKQAATGSDGVLRGVSWQGCPGGYVYRRSIAKEVFGTDDIEKIQEQLADWDKFTVAAETLKRKGYKILSGYDDALRVYSKNVSRKCVSDDGTIQLDPSVEKWIETTKEYTDKGYNNGTALWADEWTADMGKDGKVFGYFMPAWGINFSMAEGAGAKKNADGSFTPGGSYGDWAVVIGPQAFNWGGSFICGAAGTDNADLVADIMKKLCCNKDIMYNISKDTSDFVNNKAANEQLDKDGVTSDFLGGQSLVKALSASADRIDCSNVSPYDQIYAESLMAKMKDYYQGKVDRETAISNFKDEMIKSYPDLKK